MYHGTEASAGPAGRAAKEDVRLPGGVLLPVPGRHHRGPQGYRRGPWGGPGRAGRGAAQAVLRPPGGGAAGLFVGA